METLASLAEEVDKGPAAIDLAIFDHILHSFVNLRRGTLGTMKGCSPIYISRVAVTEPRGKVSKQGGKPRQFPVLTICHL